MSESQIVLPAFSGSELTLLWLVLGSAIFALGYGLWLRRRVLAMDPGPPSMVAVSRAIEEGAMAYLSRQLRTMGLVIIPLTIGLYFIYRPVYRDNPTLAAGVAIAFLLGCLASYGAGYVGMTSAVRGNVRVANAARRSFKEAMEVAFQAGTVSGMFTVGLGLLGAVAIFMVFKQDAMRVLVGFGFGGSLVAAFMRIGGGIYTKAADVGADLVGKVEAGIPEDDPRNAAVIADNVGDNVGDCAGMAADVFESYEVTLVAAIILGAATLLEPSFRAAFPDAAAAQAFALKLIFFPLLVRAVGVFASIVGTWTMKASESDLDNPMRPITRGFWVSAILATIGFGVVTVLYMKDMRYFFATFSGIVLAIVIERITDYYTGSDRAPVTEIAYSSKTGSATLLLSGLGFGLESSVWSIVAIAGTIFASFAIFGGDLALSAYGIALAGLGLLTTTGYILAEDTFGPIVDNANGIFEMSGVERGGDTKAGRVVARLDQVGNTTKALTKGFAIATAVVAATALFRSYLGEAHLIVSDAALADSLRQGSVAVQHTLERVGIQVNLPMVFIGMLIGGAIPFLVSAFLIRAVGRSAFQVVEEVRRQFREIPGIMEGKNRPDYSRCVDIVTAAAQRELMPAVVVAIATTVVVGFGLGAGALGGYLAGSILSAQLLAVFMANTGGAWDNAKKKIEDGYLGGKGTDNHKAAVVGDTVGDPLKDTAGPALNPLIKVMNLVAILIAPLIIGGVSELARIIVIVVMLALIGGSVVASRRGGVSQAEAA